MDILRSIFHEPREWALWPAVVTTDSEQSCGLVALPHSEDEGDRFILIYWYKNRGKTDNAMVWMPERIVHQVEPLLLKHVDEIARLTNR